MSRIPIVINGEIKTLSAGGQNILIEKIINDFAPEDPPTPDFKACSNSLLFKGHNVKTTLKPRFQPQAGNAPHCGSAASQEAEPPIGIPSQRLGTS